MGGRENASGAASCNDSPPAEAPGIRGDEGNPVLGIRGDEENPVLGIRGDEGNPVLGIRGDEGNPDPTGAPGIGEGARERGPVIG